MDSRVEVADKGSKVLLVKRGPGEILALRKYYIKVSPKVSCAGDLRGPEEIKDTLEVRETRETPTLTV